MVRANHCSSTSGTITERLLVMQARCSEFRAQRWRAEANCFEVTAATSPGGSRPIGDREGETSVINLRLRHDGCWPHGIQSQTTGGTRRCQTSDASQPTAKATLWPTVLAPHPHHGLLPLGPVSHPRADLRRHISDPTRNGTPQSCRNNAIEKSQSCHNVKADQCFGRLGGHTYAVRIKYWTMEYQGLSKGVNRGVNPLA